MNYGMPGGTILPDVQATSLFNDCRYEQLMKSLPQFVFLTFGSMDAREKSFT
jgi:hypothetical protein